MLFLGITGDMAGVGPRGPVGMDPVLATASNLAPGVHRFTLHWMVPAGAGPSTGYYLGMVTFWPNWVKSQAGAAEGPRSPSTSSTQWPAPGSSG